MKNNECAVVRDLLDIYADGICGEDTKELVKGHLKSCPECREELLKITNTAPASAGYGGERSVMKKIRRKMNIITIFVAAIACSLALSSALYYFLIVNPDAILPPCVTFNATVYDEPYYVSPEWSCSREEVDDAVEALKNEVKDISWYNGSRIKEIYVAGFDGEYTLYNGDTYAPNNILRVRCQINFYILPSLKGYSHSENISCYFWVARENENAEWHIVNRIH